MTSKYYMIQLVALIAARLFETAWVHMKADTSKGHFNLREQ